MPNDRRARVPASRTIAWIVSIVALGGMGLALSSADERGAGLVLNTLALAAAVCLVALPLGTTLGVLLARTDLPARGVLAALVAALVVVPLYVVCGGWQAGFGLQGWFTLAVGGPAWVDGWRGAVWIHAMAAAPWVALIVGAGLHFVPRELEEQALLDVSPAEVFLRVTLRQSLGLVAVAALWIVVLTAGDMTVTDQFQIRTFAEEIYTATKIENDPDAVPLWTLVGAAAVGALIVGGLALTRRAAPRNASVSASPPLVFALGRWRWPALVIVGLLVALLVGVPAANLAWKAGVRVERTPEGIARSWSAAKCAAIVADSPRRHGRELYWSLVPAALAAATAVAMAIPLAWQARRGGWRTAPLVAVTATALAVPGPAVGLAIIALVNRPSLGLAWLYDQTILAPWLAQTIRALPAATLILWHAIATIPRDMIDHATLEGAGAPTILARLVLPQRLPAVAIAWLLGVVLALSDVATSVLVTPPGMASLAIRIFDLLHAGVEDQVAGICLFLLLAFPAIVLGALALARWRTARR